MSIGPKYSESVISPPILIESSITFRTIPWNKPFYAEMGFLELDQPTPHLAATLADEAAQGFEDRCAMRLSL